MGGAHPGTARDTYHRASPAQTPVAPGDPRTLGFGTDQARWLKEELRRKQQAGETGSKFRMYGANGRQQAQAQAQQQQAEAEALAQQQQAQAQAQARAEAHAQAQALAEQHAQHARQQAQAQAQRQAHAQQHALPPGWEELLHEGHPYYLHQPSGHSQWERPTA